MQKSRELSPGGQATNVPTAKPMEQVLPDYLSHRDVPCPNCGYNLQNLRGTSCPECGQELELMVDLRSPLLSIYRHLRRSRLRWNAWPIWLSALPLVTAFVLPLVTWMLARIPIALWNYQGMFATFFVAILVVASAAMLAIWWRRTGDMLQWSKPGQLLFVVACWVVAGLVLALYSLPLMFF